MAQNGSLPIQLELGSTTMNSTDANFMVTETMYSIFERFNLGALLIDSYELRDREDLFTERFNTNTPHVLSNVYPKNPDSDFAKLKQHHMINLGGGIKVYIVNIIDPADNSFARSRIMIDHYDIIEPDVFLNQFIEQISERDILIAMFNFETALVLRQILESPAASRIDLAIIPFRIADSFLDDEEKNLAKSALGWNTRPISPSQNDDNDEIQVDLSIENREFMEITNQFHAIPDVRSAEYIREVHFKKNPEGNVVIEVADILIDKNFPPDKEIDETVEKIEQAAQEQRDKSRLNSQIQNISRRISYGSDNPYVGVNSCIECHPSAYEVWENSRHSKALDTLVAENKHQDSNCLKCHLTQWERPDDYMQEWTFDNFGDELGCESCHGPGLSHINLIDLATDRNNYEYWDYIKSQEPQLLTRNLTVEARAKCMECHDLANSPGFDFVKYWEQIEHPMDDISIMDIVDQKQKELQEEARARKVQPADDEDADEKRARLISPDS